jgi:hypothetical protein
MQQVVRTSLSVEFKRHPPMAFELHRDNNGIISTGMDGNTMDHPDALRRCPVVR